jgi:hypothetical protein
MNQPDEIHSEFERRLQEQYREAARETPPASLDKRILDAARAAAAEGPARGEPGGAMGGMAANDFPVNDVAFHADRDDAPRVHREEFRWGKPLALAAAVVLGLGIVVQVQMHRPDLSPAADGEKMAKAEIPAAPAPVPAAPAPAPAASAPAAEPSRDDKVAAMQLPAGGMAGNADARAKDAAESAVAQRKTAAPREQEAPRQLAEAQAAKKAAGAGEPVRAQARSRLDPLAQQELAKEEAAAKMRDSAASELKRMEGAPQTQGSVLASNAAKPDAAGRTLSSAPAPAAAAAPMVPAAPAVAAAPPPPPAPAAPAPVQAPSAIARAQAPATAAVPGAPARSAETASVATPVYESDPDLWARRIIDMRRSGRTAQADSELKRLRARYPDFRVPAEALAPTP